MNANFYYIKYLKYKSKYLKYKEQIGGVLGTNPCPKEYTLEEILTAIKDESGNFDSIKLKKINENRKIDLNLIKSHLPFSILFDSDYSEEDLRDSGFLPNEFISLYKERKKLSKYYKLTRLKELFTLENLLTNKISLEDILQIGYEPCELKELRISVDLFKEII